MFSVQKERVQLMNATTLLAEASEIGLAPGEWPDFIAVLDKQGEGFLFRLGQRAESETTYFTKDGALRLVVLND